MATPRVMARTLVTFYGFGGLAGLLAALGAAPGTGRRWAIVGIAGTALVTAAVFGRWGHRLPRAAFHVPVATGTVLLATGVALAPDPLTAVVIGAIVCFIAVDCYFFFAPREALAQLGGAVLVNTSALLLRGDVPLATALALDTVIVALGAATNTLARRASSANCDSLTGLANRRGFDDALQEQLNAAIRRGEPLSAALLDLDFFKQINDVEGHQAGDRVLIRVAEAWHAGMPPRAVLARHGGDEFALLMPGLTGTAALAAVRRLTTLSPGISVSCGVAEHVADETAAQLMRRADTALYAAKDAGRGRSALDGAPDT